MTFKHILRTSTALLGAALMALPSTMALAQGGDDPISGIDIIIKEDPSQAKISPFSLSDKEIAQINSIKGPERLALVLQAVTKHVKTEEGFVKSGMAVMGKDWCGECEWPKEITYKFQNGKTTYKLGMTLSEGVGDLQKRTATDRLPYKLGRLNLNMKTISASPDENSEGDPNLQFDEADALFAKRGIAGAQNALDENSLEQGRHPDFDMRDAPKPLEDSESNNTAILKTLSAKEHQRLIAVKDLK